MDLEDIFIEGYLPPNELKKRSILHQNMAHNHAYLTLSKKHPLPDLKVIDQFAEEKKYYEYLKGVDEVITGIHFETKAENKYPSVAVGSIIARFAFLQEMDKLSEQYQMTFEKGAGEIVDQFGKKFVEKYGVDELKKVAKLHFKNTQKILEEPII